MTANKLAAANRWTVAALLSIAALSTAAPASADETDEIYLQALEMGGITITNRTAAIAMGHTVCTALDQGVKPTGVVATLMGSAGLSPTEAGHTLGVSVAAYCPQYRSLIK